jgi:hypothetical protein
MQAVQGLSAGFMMDDVRYLLHSHRGRQERVRGLTPDPHNGPFLDRITEGISSVFNHGSLSVPADSGHYYFPVPR